jgi:hypothetical protein
MSKFKVRSEKAPSQIDSTMSDEDDASVAALLDCNSDSSGSVSLIDDWAKHPVSVLWKDWRSCNKTQKRNFDWHFHEESFSTYLTELQAEPHCQDVFRTGRDRNCTCMNTMDLEGEELKSVVAAFLKFSTKTKLERNEIIADWIRYADAHRSIGSGKKAFLLPGGKQLICQHAIARACGMKSYAWRGLCKKVRAGEALDHGLTGKLSNRISTEAHCWLEDFLTRLQEQGAPRATRLVRFINGEGKMVVETRDDDEDVIDLPAHCTKLGLYKLFVAEHGWKFLYDPKNRIIDKIPIEGVEQNPEDPTYLPSLKTFLNHWEINFPKMKIQKSAADICDECFVWANQVRYKQRLTGKVGKEALLEEGDDTVPAAAIKESEQITLQSEHLILSAADHVKKQQSQRDLFVSLKKKAKKWGNHASRNLQLHTFVADYAQNMSVPNFAGEQPGKAYYLSPLNAYVFGVVDCSKEKTTLAAHTYFETDGKKGGNNVASMLWNELRRKGLTTGEMVQEINIVMDNCAGQNKNRMVIRLLFVLIKLKRCFRARLVFLVKGHTKNDCDRMFNLMKKRYRKTNCYTPNQLLEFVKTSNEDVELVDVMNGGGGFKNWDKYENKYMRCPDAIQGFHLFTVTSNEPNRLVCQAAHGFPPHYDDTIVRKEF